MSYVRKNSRKKHGKFWNLNLVCDGDLFLVLADLPTTVDLHKHEIHGWQPQIANLSFIGFVRGYYFYFNFEIWN